MYFLLNVIAVTVDKSGPVLKEGGSAPAAAPTGGGGLMAEMLEKRKKMTLKGSDSPSKKVGPANPSPISPARSSFKPDSFKKVSTPIGPNIPGPRASKCHIFSK